MLLRNFLVQLRMHRVSHLLIAKHSFWVLVSLPECDVGSSRGD